MTMKEFPMRNVILALCLAATVALGVASSAGTALAANCTVNPLQPGVNHHPPTNVGTATSIQCDTGGTMRWIDILSLGDAPGYTWLYPWNGNGNYGPWNTFTITPSFVLWAQFPCPITGYHWWGHALWYQIKWAGNSSYGPQHQTVVSAGSYDACA